MSAFNLQSIPLSLYIHFPWCVRKCPYCDFNSHELKNNLSEEQYIAALQRDLLQELDNMAPRSLRSIFMGGGTPSLFSPRAIENLLEFVLKHFSYDASLEITLEANPGTVDFQRFADFRQAGINRLSMGIQSFQDKQLKLLGRIHHGAEAQHAIAAAQQAGFSNFNLDIMHGLPEQTVEDALKDIQTALSFAPPHFSWYQLTIEPNTYFHRFPPVLPQEDDLVAIQEAAQALLQEAGLLQYEVSAYSQSARQCQHNLNYWEFGDYIGIGAGAHGKITTNTEVMRYWKYRQPKDYLQHVENYRAETQKISVSQLPFEFMLNALRLKKPISEVFFQQRTGLNFSAIEKPLQTAEEKGLLTLGTNVFVVTERGHLFLNDLITLFM